MGSSAEEMEMDQCGMEGTRRSSQMSPPPGCLARSWAHSNPEAQLPKGCGGSETGSTCMPSRWEGKMAEDTEGQCHS